MKFKKEQITDDEKLDVLYLIDEYYSYDEALEMFEFFGISNFFQKETNQEDLFNHEDLIRYESYRDNINLFNGIYKYIGVNLEKFYIIKANENLFVESDGDIYNLEDYILECDLSLFFEDEAFSVDLPSVAYHATKEENLESILENGLGTKNESRGLTNRYIGSAVFLSENPNAIDAYGDVILEVDLRSFVESLGDVDINDIFSREEFYSEKDLRESLGHFFNISIHIDESYDGTSPEDIICYHNIPPDFISVYDENNKSYSNSFYAKILTGNKKKLRLKRTKRIVKNGPRYNSYNIEDKANDVGPGAKGPKQSKNFERWKSDQASAFMEFKPIRYTSEGQGSAWANQQSQVSTSFGNDQEYTFKFSIPMSYSHSKELKEDTEKVDKKIDILKNEKTGEWKSVYGKEEIFLGKNFQIAFEFLRKKYNFKLASYVEEIKNEDISSNTYNF